MPRVKKQSSNSSYRPVNFSKKNNSLIRFGQAAMLSSGILSRENIIDLSNKTLFGQLKNEEYIQETSEKGVFRTTEKFEKKWSEYTGDVRMFGGTTSGEQHQRLVSDIVSKVPDSTLFSGSFKNGNVIATETKQYKETTAYKNDLNMLRKQVTNELRDLESDYQSKMDSTSNSLEKASIKAEYLEQKGVLTMHDQVLHSKKPISAPDFQISINTSECESFFNAIRELEQDEHYSRYKDQWEDNIDKMQEYVSSSEEDVVTLNIEVIDRNYSARDIYQKEVWGCLNSQPVFYLRT